MTAMDYKTRGQRRLTLKRARPNQSFAPFMADQIQTCPPHRYRLEEPSGPYSVGRCTKCGHEKVQRNWIPDLDYLELVSGNR